jgi:hypothetical protein
VKQRRLRAVLRGGMSDADQQEAVPVAQQPPPPVEPGEGGGVDKKAAAEEAKKQQQQQQQQQLEEQEGIQSLGFLVNFVGKRLGRSEATTNLQNALGLLVKLMRGVRQLLEWEYPPVTLAFLLLLLGSAAAHCLFLSTTYLFVIGELAVFGVLTWPLQTFVWYTVRGLRVARSLAVQLAWGLKKRGAVAGEISDEAFAAEIQGVGVGVGAGGGAAEAPGAGGGFGEAKAGEEEQGR